MEACQRRTEGDRMQVPKGFESVEPVLVSFAEIGTELLGVLVAQREVRMGGRPTNVYYFRVKGGTDPRLIGGVAKVLGTVVLDEKMLGVGEGEEVLIQRTGTVEGASGAFKLDVFVNRG